MGYETKMYLCELNGGFVTSDKLEWASVIGMVDLCKMGACGLPDCIRQKYLKLQDNKKVCYIYADDGGKENV